MNNHGIVYLQNNNFSLNTNFDNETTHLGILFILPDDHSLFYEMILLYYTKWFFFIILDDSSLSYCMLRNSTKYI